MKALASRFAVFALFATCSLPAILGQETSEAWPELTAINKPWTRWWWHGSAVEESEIARELAAFKAAGIGGVEITPIYGVKGEEARNLEFLSEEWLARVRFACEEANRLGLGVDIVPGTGWRLGREDIPPDERAVELRLERSVDADGNVAYAAIAEPSGERVKRPAPGGSGYTIDMLDHDAVANYIDDFHKRFFAAIPSALVRAEFHDSWEYDTDWTRDFMTEFERRRGYSLQPYLGVFDKEHPLEDAEVAARVRYDYRITIEELVLQNFSANWGERLHELGIVSRNQAHGTIGNILDVYAAADIPETEIFRDRASPLVQKFASSAAHVAGLPLVSAESFTWLSEHWQSDLGKIRRFADYLFICGINHIFFHGTAYSPAEAAWPGWVFYASTQINDRNPIWNHLPALNRYIARCQSLLQQGQPFHDTLLYWPISDLYSERPGTVFKFHINGDHWTAGEPLRVAAQELWDVGAQFDYVSDRQLQQLSADSGSVSMGGASYRAIVVPELKRIPVETVRALADLAEAGVPVIYQGGALDWDVPGLPALEERRAELAIEMERLVTSPSYRRGTHPTEALMALGIQPEAALQKLGAHCERRILPDGSVLYFVVNVSGSPIDATVAFASGGSNALLMDAWTERVGSVAAAEPGAFRLQLEPNASLFALVREPPYLSVNAWTYSETNDAEPFAIAGPWQAKLLSGGPELIDLPPLDTLNWLGDMGDPALESFAGLIQYRTRFDLPPSGTASQNWRLDLGAVGSSARALLNGEDLGITAQAPFRYEIDSELLRAKDNELIIEVATLAANRIRKLDRDQTPWRIFDDINFVNLDYKSFDASDWPTFPTGLKGPVTIVPIQR